MSYCCHDCANDVESWSDEDLIDELRDRKGPGAKMLGLLREDYEIVYRAVQEGRRLDALAYLDRMTDPRWRSIEKCREAYKLALPPPAPKTGLWFWHAAPHSPQRRADD